MEELKLFSHLGIGGVLGGMIFWFYRQDHKQLVELHLNTTKALADNTAAVAELRATLSAHLIADQLKAKEAAH